MKRSPKDRATNRRRLTRGAALLLVLGGPAAFGVAVREAPAGFTGETNGVSSQGQFDADLATFAEREEAADGLGPVYNAPSCADCHGNPTTGGASQVTVVRFGRFDGRRFQDPPGGSLLHDRAIEPAAQVHATRLDNVQALRLSPAILGDGFVEAIADSTFEAIRAAQPPGMRGTIVRVPVLEAPGTTRVGRFGWKCQHASLLSFAADAYLNEMGITSPLQPAENSSYGHAVDAWDAVPDPEDEPTAAEPFGSSVTAFARLMRSTLAPPRDADLAATATVQAGEQTFLRIGCGACHVPAIVTAPAGTALAGGTFVVPAALGTRTIHPYGDFLLHDVGTGDGIVQNGGERTRTMLRTAPLWGLRTRSRLMHDGASLTPGDAIRRHGGEARPVADAFQRLPPEEKDALLAFLSSL